MSPFIYWICSISGVFLLCSGELNGYKKFCSTELTRKLKNVGLYLKDHAHFIAVGDAFMLMLRWWNMMLRWSLNLNGILIKSHTKGWSIYNKDAKSCQFSESFATANQRTDTHTHFLTGQKEMGSLLRRNYYEWVLEGKTYLRKSDDSWVDSWDDTESSSKSWGSTSKSRMTRASTFLMSAIP